VYKIGDLIKIYRLVEGKNIYVGNAKIIQLRNSQCALEIISESKKIKAGDFSKQNYDKDTNKPIYSNNNQDIIKRDKRNYTLTYLTLGAGLIASGVGYNYYNKTIQTYDNYKIANTRDETDRLYAEAEKYNSNTKISLSIGGGLIAYAIINELFIKPLSQKSNNLSIYPLIINKSICLSYSF
jgi:hypothetical protein